MGTLACAVREAKKIPTGDMNMTMIASKSLRSTLLGVAVGVLVSAPASAATQTFTAIGPSVKAPQGAVFQLDKFDPSLGTLKQVDLTWTTYASVNAQINQNGAGSANLFDAGLKFTFNAPQVSILAENVPTFLFAWPDNTASPYLVASSLEAAVGNGQQVNQVNWAPYIGQGKFNVAWAIEEFSKGAGPNWIGTDGFQSGVLDDRLGGYNFSVTYNYDVPEPGTLALLALGLAGMGLRRRSR